MKGLPTVEELRDVDRRYPVDPAQVRALMARVKPSWTLVEKTAHGGAFVRGALRVFMTLELMDDHNLWIHVSVSGAHSRTQLFLPDWEQMKRVKTDFIGEDCWAYSVLPPLKEYVNHNPYVLHLYALFDNRSALPDFTRGLGVL